MSKIRKEEQDIFNKLKNRGRISQDNIESIGTKFPNFTTHNLQKKKDGSGFGWRPRAKLEKDLLKFTVDTLSREDVSFNNLVISDELNARGHIARGYIDRPGNTMYINSNLSYQPDIAHTIIHEGNHVIDRNFPHIRESTKQFLIKKAEKSEDIKIKKGEIPALFEGMQDIINLPPSHFKDLYKADNDIQKNEVSLQDLKENSFISNAVSFNFNELTAHALEAQMRKIPFNINEEINDDSRSLLKRILRGTYRQYAELGFAEEYKESSNLLKDRVVELRDRKKYPTKEKYLESRGYKFSQKANSLDNDIHNIKITLQQKKEYEQLVKDSTNIPIPLDSDNDWDDDIINLALFPEKLKGSSFEVSQATSITGPGVHEPRVNTNNVNLIHPEYQVRATSGEGQSALSEMQKSHHYAESS